MRKLLLFCLCYFFVTLANAQAVQRRIRFTPVDKDSLDLALNANYYLIEDSCAFIVRHIRFDFETRKFHGRFTDNSTENPAVVLTEGTYNDDGMKEGKFTLRYLNNNIKAVGNFKDDAFDGRWEMFYEDGKPELVFEAKEDILYITDAWDSRGKKIVDKGEGNYVATVPIFSWRGKLSGGRPDGTWKMYRTIDNYKQTVSSEHFKKGEFEYGESPAGKYTDLSRLNLVDMSLFPFINAEKMFVGPPCDMALAINPLVNAHYAAGMDSFKYHLRDALSRLFEGSDLEGKQGNIHITGVISKEGHIENLVRTGGTNVGLLAQGVIKAIENLPTLIPATQNGKPISEDFVIDLDIGNSTYSFTFKFMVLRLK
ncbi:MAG TPA: hypothetical protein VHA56_02855 [Mucilaginibacter sp.]|nr:hypothetical protein [Mucilaginibacter sp.]